MLTGRRRILAERVGQLEADNAAMRDLAGQLECESESIRCKLDEMLGMAATAGVRVTHLDEDAVRDIPAPLIFAASRRRPGGIPVMLTGGDGRQVIAVIGGTGDPASWWRDIQAQAALS